MGETINVVVVVVVVVSDSVPIPAPAASQSSKTKHVSSSPSTVLVVPGRRTFALALRHPRKGAAGDIRSGGGYTVSRGGMEYNRNLNLNP